MNVLESEIPLGADGRHLTSAECAKLRAGGIACDERYIVVRAAVHTPKRGWLYAPTYNAERYAGVGVEVG